MMTLLKDVVLFFGEALIIKGGIVSLTPPVGIPFFAQSVNRKTKNKKIKDRFLSILIIDI